MSTTRTFHGRGQELGLLDSLWASPKAALLILYGRRRIGKTRLLTHWIGLTGNRACYWVAEPSSAVDQLRAFSQIVYDFANPDAPAPGNFTYATWAQAWQQIARLAERDRLALFIDEFTYLLEADPGIAGGLQNAWDHTLTESNLLLVLSGSHLGMMQRHTLSYQAPLYGRATAQLHLQPLPFGATKGFFPDYSPDERVAIYAMFGGIPAYWERLDSKATVSENIKSQLIDYTTTPRLITVSTRLVPNR